MYLVQYENSDHEQSRQKERRNKIEKLFEDVMTPKHIGKHFPRIPETCK